MNKDEICSKMLYSWVRLKQKQYSIADFLEYLGIESVLIYGAGLYGILILNELRESKIKVVAGVDAEGGRLDFNLNVLSPKDELPDTDAIIITPIWVSDEIIRNLEKQGKSRCINLDDLVYSCIAWEEGAHD